MASMTTGSTPFADPEGFERAADLLTSAEHITVLTGAGVSTDSGIPDFRGPQGVWTKDPHAQALSDIDTYMADVDVRRRAWLQRRSHQALAAEPNGTHRALAELAATGRMRGLITQNIDGLHQKAGLPDESVIEVHGTTLRVVCMACGLRTPSEADRKSVV